MSATRAEIRAKLIAEAEQAIGELLDWTDQTPRPNLPQIENAVLKMRRHLSEQAAQAVSEAPAQRARGASSIRAVVAACCGSTMRTTRGSGQPMGRASPR